jgi:3',5'-cyclic AMP phosphodiesterase CpdA
MRANDGSENDAAAAVSGDGIDRRGFLECMAWAGTGLLWTIAGGIASSRAFAQSPADAGSGAGGFRFVQISDSHVGFSKPANTDVVATLQAAVAKINALPEPPDFILHTGDISHLSKADEFDTVDQILKTAKAGRVLYVPGEHDVLTDNGAQYLARYGKDAKGNGWYSFDHNGVHFIGLVNVVNLQAGGLGRLGPDQLAWLSQDVAGLASSTPIVVFAHIPLWSVYPEWGWGTDDSAQALALLKRFGSVTVLNGHIHQTLQKVEGNVTFHTATSTAFPQPHPGMAPSPGPMTVPADHLRDLLGITTVQYVERRSPLAIVDSSLAVMTASGDPTQQQVLIDNFQFSPSTLAVAAGTTVTWVNHDDIPHTIVSTEQRFRSAALDTDDRFSFRFVAPGVYPYFCSVHPMMVGKVIVR